ncbi:MAG: VOC family protein [Pyrinomonadaceae bacterium]
MKFLNLTPLIRTKYVSETIKFYTQVLCFQCLAFDEEAQWASLKRDTTELMVAAPNTHAEFHEPIFTGSLYFQIDDVEELWNTVKDKAKICYEPDVFDWNMREFGIFDNNGYLLQFGEEIE